jgi:hypothetical protein
VSKARDDVLDMIEVRVKKNKTIRENTCRDKTHRQEVMRFLRDMEDLFCKASNEIEASTGIDGAADMLISRLRAFDPYVKANIIWNDADIEDGKQDWKQLKVIGVQITWSDYYIRFNPNADRSEYVDVMDLLFDQ